MAHQRKLRFVGYSARWPGQGQHATLPQVHQQVLLQQKALLQSRVCWHVPYAMSWHDMLEHSLCQWLRLSRSLPEELHSIKLLQADDYSSNVRTAVR
jgi:hypothetical protein